MVSIAPSPLIEAATGICRRSASWSNSSDGATVADGLTDKNHRSLGAEQHIDRLDDALRVGAATA